ncbi:hypothetical protein VmeM32_00134 [Vibrio phage vB_VmeM-32]|nr:hypothetical protein VmeM32_00134 [Vibrio phage vB_VmeM-32]
MEKVQFINQYTTEIHNFVNSTIKPNLGIYLEADDVDRIEEQIFNKVKRDFSVQKSKIRYYIVSVILKEFGTLAFGVELGKDLRKKV